MEKKNRPSSKIDLRLSDTPNEESTFPPSCHLHRLYRFIEPLILLLLWKKAEAYGYEMFRYLQAHPLTGGRTDFAAIYRTLALLEKNDFVISSWQKTEEGHRQRKYKITPSGETHLQAWRQNLHALKKNIGLFEQAFKKKNS